MSVTPAHPFYSNPRRLSFEGIPPFITPNVHACVVKAIGLIVITFNPYFILTDNHFFLRGAKGMLIL